MSFKILTEKEEADGSLTMSIEMTRETMEYLVSVGLLKLINDAIAKETPPCKGPYEYL